MNALNRERTLSTKPRAMYQHSTASTLNTEYVSNWILSKPEHYLKQNPEYWITVNTKPASLTIYPTNLFPNLEP